LINGGKMKNFSLILLVLFTILLLNSCHKPETTTGNAQLLKQYVAVWNGDNPNILSKIADKNFQLRMVPDFKKGVGIENLKNEIFKTRNYFPDFILHETEAIFFGDTAAVVSWTASGTFKNRDKITGKAGKIDVPGFSIIFFKNGKVTGEWIAYSDLTWYKQLGFTLTPPGKSR